MTNLQDKIDNIISELNFIKNNLEKKQSMEDFCAAFKLALISKLEQAGVRYNPALEYKEYPDDCNTTDDRKFFAFKLSKKPTEREILNRLDNAHRILENYIASLSCQDVIFFNVLTLENLSEEKSPENLFRGCFVIKEKQYE